MPRILVILSIAFAVFGFLAILYLERLKNRPYIFFKAVTSATNVVIGIFAVRNADRIFAGLLIASLIFCFFGDLFLALGHEIDNNLKDPQFTIGVGSFLIAQAILAGALFRFLSFRADWTLLIVIVPVLSVPFFNSRKDYDFGTNKYPTMIYGIFIGLMCAMALSHLIRRPHGTLSVVLGIGGVLFFCSDLILMFKFFRKKTTPHIGIAVLTVYFLAIWLLAAGVPLSAALEAGSL